MKKVGGKISKNISGIEAVSRFVRIAVDFKSEITIQKDGIVGNAKSIMFVLNMRLDKDSEVTIVASGKDEEAAVEALSNVLGF